MNKSYLVVLAVAVVAVAFYFVFFSQQAYSFDSGLTEINSFYEKQELNSKDLINPIKVNSLNESKLNALKSDLIEFQSLVEKQEKSEDKEKLLMLTETHLDLVENALLQKKNFKLIDFFESSEYDFDVLCDSMNKAEELQQNLILQKNFSDSFNEKIIIFSSEFPEEAEKAEISRLELAVNSQENLSELQAVLLVLQGVC